EDDPRYNAGRGACLTREGTVELDASVMDGHTLAFGGVCALPPFRNPVAVARAVLTDGRHCLYAASGAREIAVRAGFVPCEPEVLVTAAARARWAEVRAGRADAGWPGGTVGAVAFDGEHLAAATSTGGMGDRAAGRGADSSIPRACTVADDNAGASSATGH